MRAQYFVGSIFGTFVLLGVLYVVVYFVQVQRKANDVVSYKHYLLEHTKGVERIIIDSGSNSHHGLDSAMMQEGLGRLVINIADTGSFPLKNKLYRLDAHTQKGDMVLMPLEYLHYSYDAVTQSYHDGVFDTIAFYFTPLPLDEKLLFVWHTPFSSLFRSLFYSDGVRDYTQNYKKRFQEGERGEHIFVKKRPLDYWSAKSSCENYLFYVNKKSDFALADVFVENVALMKRIEQEKGVRFVLTYPSVAGDGCYEGVLREKFLGMMEQVKALLEKNGIEFVGSYEDGYFGAEEMDNTYYHVLPSAKEKRTKQLIELLREE
jgi:hypothetical protein